MRRPDFAEIERIRSLIAKHNDELPARDQIGEWRGQYQIDMMHAMLDNPWCIIQGIPQNSGKTYCASLLSCARVADGQNGVWCYPTLRQGARVAFRRVDNWMRILERELDLHRIQPDGAFEKAWDNGGSLMVLSLDVSAKAGVQGYTLEFGFLDESHEITQVEEVIGAIFSRFDIAMQKDYGSVCLLGVGGARDSLIESAKKIDDFRVFQYPASRVMADYPPARASIERAKRMLPDIAWDQFYELKPVAVGKRSIFNGILETCQLAKRRHSVGIDVGKTTDYTVAIKLAQGGSTALSDVRCFEIEDVLTLPHNLKYAEQAQAIHDWMRNFEDTIIPGAITVETNGPGLGLLESLQEIWPAVGGVHIEDNEANTGLKSMLIHELRIAAQQGAFAIPASLTLCRGESAREHFDGLTYNVDEKGRIEWEHSDYLSALIMATYGI